MNNTVHYSSCYITHALHCVNIHLHVGKLQLTNKYISKLGWNKADRPLTHDMPPDYWQTDNSNGLVMVIHNYHWLNSASRVLISTCSASLVQTGECKQFSLLTFDLDLQSQASQGQGRPSNQKSRSKVKWFLPTDKHADGCYQTYYRPCYAVDNSDVNNVYIVRQQTMENRLALTAVEMQTLPIIIKTLSN